MIRPRTLADVRSLLEVSGDEQAELFRAARTARELATDNGVILRGVIEITNVCRVNCTYCPMRRENTRRNRSYVLTQDEVLQRARAIQQAGIDVVFLQGGEIPHTTSLLVETIPQIKRMFGGRVEVLLNLGNKHRAEYEDLYRAGADSYILKVETLNEGMHEVHRGELLEERIRCLEDLIDIGYRTGSGVIVGLPGQTVDDLARELEFVRSYPLAMYSVSPFIPAPDTPLAECPRGDIEVTLNALAIIRLLRPDVLIPAVSALRSAEDDGQVRGLLAGANVLTANFSGESRQDDYLIYGRDRRVARLGDLLRTCEAAGLVRRGSVMNKMESGGGRRSSRVR